MPNLLLESGRDDVPTGVETDGQTPGIAICGLQSDVSEVVYSRSRCVELRNQAFNDGKNDVQTRNLLVLFLIGSRFHLIFAFYINSSPNPGATVVHATGHQIICSCRSVSEVEKAQLLNPLMNSGFFRWICIWAISSVCAMYILSAELNEVPDQLRHFCGTFRRICGIVPYHSLLFQGGSSNVVDVAHTGVGLSGAISSFFSFSLFIACIILVAHNIVELQSDREWVENESVDKDYPQKTILEIHYCNHQYPLRISSQNIVFVPGELWRASKNRYVFAPYQFHMTFLGFVESVRRRSVEHIRTDSKIQCL